MGFEEEAIEEEMWESVMNLACAEEHLLETVIRELDDYEKNQDNSILNNILEHLMKMHELRIQRKALVNEIIKLRKSTTDKEETGMRSGTGELWCCVKHMLITKMHLFETAQKYVNLANKTGDKLYMQKAIQVMRMAKDIQVFLLETIDEVFPKEDQNL